MRSDLLIHVIDDDEAVRRSLRLLLLGHGLRVQTYEDAAAFLASLPAGEQGLVLTDVRMPGMTGVELIRELRARGCTLPVVVITGHGDVALAVEAMKSGAADLLEKPFEETSLLRAIHGAIEAHAPSAADAQTRRRLAEIFSTLSTRESEVLHGLLAGKSNKMIARDLGIGPRTVETYRANVMSKTEAASLSELVQLATMARLS